MAPLLVVQVPSTPSRELLLSAFATIREAWPELEPGAMAHVFGDHAPVEVGSFTVPHVSPETVQDRTQIRVLFAKDAISTGWDCPRAEVLVSFRPAKDETHITQLLGRMVRTPLARRVPGNDLLNSVECLLPHFDRNTAARAAKAMLGDREHDEDGTGGGAGRRVLLVPVDLVVNPAISEAVWEAFDALPSQTLPRRAARPAGRLAALAQALAQVDGVAADLDREADELARDWFDEHRVAIKGLTDERQTAYDEIRSMSTEPQAIEIKRPRVRTEETEDENGQKLPTRTGHLVCDADGAFPVGALNQWEREVVDREMDRVDFLAWYRNPSRPSSDALAVAYRDPQGRWRRMCPDFLFFHGDGGNVNVSIVDPHGLHLADALSKLQGLGDFADAHGEFFHRIEAVARTAVGELRVLDLKDAAVRGEFRVAEDLAALYSVTGAACR